MPDIKMMISAVYWTDRVYASKCYTYFSMNKFTSEFETWQERFANKYSQLGYELDELKRVRAGPEAKTIKF